MKQFQTSPLINASDIKPAPHTFIMQCWPVRFDPAAPDFSPYLLVRATLEDGTIADMKIEAHSAVRMLGEMIQATQQTIAPFTSGAGDVLPFKQS